MSETERRVTRLKPQSAEDVRAAGELWLVFSDALREEEAVLRRFLMARMYRHWKVNRSRSQAKRVLKELFDVFLADPELLPPNWQDGGDGRRDTKPHAASAITSPE